MMKMKYQREIKRILVKVGTSTLTHENGKINISSLERIVRDISDLHNKGYEVILVSSGAVGAGMGSLKEKKKPNTLPKKQAAAAIGQVVLMHMYQKLFAEYGKIVGQVLLTREDLSNRKRNLNAKNTLTALFKMGAIPIINENDTVSTAEIKVGDNDRLAALVATLVDGDILIILSDVDGLYTANPQEDENAVLIEKVEKITEEITLGCGSEGSCFGTGGMLTKLEAAKISMAAGVYMAIGNGSKDHFIRDVVEGDFKGTLFIPLNKKIHTKKKWLLFSSRAKGVIKVDEGAAKALVTQGKSLLPIGITGVEGDFKALDVVSIVDENNQELGRGISFYDGLLINHIKGLKTKEIEKLLGIDFEYDTVIHRDNLSIKEGGLNNA